MAYSYLWPLTLPQKPQENYSETGGVLLLRTPTDRGPAKQRRLGNRIQTMQLSFHMSPDQLEIFRIFVEDTIRGTARFGFPHPRTGAVVEARIVPESGGQMYVANYVMQTVFSVSLNMEILP